MRWFRSRSRKVQFLVVGILLLSLCGCVGVLSSKPDTDTSQPLSFAPPSEPTSGPANTPTVAAATHTSAPRPTATAKPTNTERPTQTPRPPTATPLAIQVAIRAIFYDGITASESDEHAELVNTGRDAVNLKGWRLNAGTEGQDFVFPDFTLQPGQTCRVYTNEVHTDTGGFSFGSKQAIWANKGDCGYLFDAAGAQVAKRCY